MTLNPFAAIGDYPAMLNKIAISTFFTTLSCIFLLRYQVPEVAQLLDCWKYTVPVEKFEIPVGVLLPALVVAVLSRVTKLHDRVSDLFRIRARFDIEAILFPLALGSCVSLTVDQIKKLRQQRRRLMGETFYMYASGTNPVIDKHYVTMALDHWTWYWMLLEATVVLGLTGILLLLFSRPMAAACAELGVLVAMGILACLRTGCVSYALDEVREILKDYSRSTAISGVFGAL